MTQRASDDRTDAWLEWQQAWRAIFFEQASKAMLAADAGHGIDHVTRVVRNAEALGASEQANPFVFLPAAWLHDCVLVPKNSPDRSKASRLAAAKAMELLVTIRYPSEYISDITHAIEAHSFSAAIECRSIEAMVVQDADRLEALGSIGIARCLMTAGSLSQSLYHVDEPFPLNRTPDDRAYSIDHFFAKLFKLPSTMKTASGRLQAQQRVSIMSDFLKQLAFELGRSASEIDNAIALPLRTDN